MLKIENLHATVADKPILKGLTLSLKPGEIHAIMGPNGAGKSTLGYVLSWRPGYEVTEGSVTFNGQDLLALDPHERAAAGLFLGFQYPVEIPGVSNVQFLRTALNAQRRARGEAEMSSGDFLKLAREKAGLLKMDMDMLKRPVNVGFSGGEKKRNEMVQMGIIDPKLAILDETDSEQDVKAMLLDRSATANAKPELEIFADDVKCAHGCAIGELDAMSLYYLQSRGLPPADAKKILLQAFVAGVFDGAEDEEKLQALALAKLGELV